MRQTSRLRRQPELGEAIAKQETHLGELKREKSIKEKLSGYKCAARKLIIEIQSRFLWWDGLTFARDRLCSLQHHPQTIQTGDGSSQVQRFSFPTLNKKRKRHKNGILDLFGSTNVALLSALV